MKISKLLFPLLTCSLIAPIAMLTSCNNKTDAEIIAEAIYSPLDKQATVATKTYFEYLKDYNADQKKNSLIYDLFGLFNIKGWRNLPSTESFTSLYKKSIVNVTTNITKCTYETTNDNKVKVNVLGYVSFIFAKDYVVDGTIYYRSQDYVMITYDVLNRIVEIDEDNFSIKYPVSDPTDPTECLGMIKEKRNSESSKLYYIKDLNTKDYKDAYSCPSNFNNFVKN